jgi:hypothetical protein
MRVNLETVEGENLRTFENVEDLNSACVDGHIVIQTEEENFILAIQKGEILVINKTKAD